MTSYQAALSIAKALVKDPTIPQEQKIELLESLKDEIQNLIDLVREEGGEQQ